MSHLLVTGGSGFLGQHALLRMLTRGDTCVSLDLEAHDLTHGRLTSIVGDIRDEELLVRIFAENRFDAVVHLASAVVAHAVKGSGDFVRTTNVDGTRDLVQLAVQHYVPKFVFISTCCLWRKSLGRPVVEEDIPDPAEEYGQTKWEAEKVLNEHTDEIQIVILRSPTIVDAGRVGLLSILFEFIEEGRKVWVVGRGDNRHQFVSAEDIVDAIERSLAYAGGGIFNVGSDDVRGLAQNYEHLIGKAGTKARVAHLPRRLSLAAMSLLYRMRLSPLGPYQYRMIAEDFVFDTSKIKREMGWVPTSANEDMLAKAYDYYRDHREELSTRDDLSAHRQAARLGAIKLLKMVS